MQELEILFWKLLLGSTFGENYKATNSYVTAYEKLKPASKKAASTDVTAVTATAAAAGDDDAPMVMDTARVKGDRKNFVKEHQH